MKRNMWLYYPENTIAINLATQYLWGWGMLIAPVFRKGAENREIYFLDENWYDWWTKEKVMGGELLPEK